jgi:predicted transcriptional regulator
MGYELWISPNTGLRRKGTTFKELQSLFINNITTKYIFEPIYSCKLTDNSKQVRKILEKRGFDIVGVTDENRKIIGYAKKTELNHGIVKQFVHNIEIHQIISVSTPISQLLNIFYDNSFVFVLENNLVNGIVTRADINKPIVRIYLFGIISLFEMHLNFWINNYYPNSSWIKIIKKERLEEAIKIYELRKGKNEELSLLECTQLGDKKTVLKSTPDFLKNFDLSKRQTEKFLRNIEKIRNELAHSQSSIISNLDWQNFVKTISFAENFLIKSEIMVEEKARLYTKIHT